MSKLPRLLQAYLFVALFDLVGAVVAVSTDLAGAERAVLSGTAINAPLPFLAVQLAIVTVAVSLAHRRLGAAAAALLVPLGTVSVLSGFSDGSFTRDLDALERAIQLGIVAATAVTVVVAARQVDHALRRRRSAAV